MHPKPIKVVKEFINNTLRKQEQIPIPFNKKCYLEIN